MAVIAWARRHARALDLTFVVAFAVLLMLPLPERPAAWQESSTLWHAVLDGLLAGAGRSDGSRACGTTAGRPSTG
jgi:hypothetical protein